MTQSRALPDADWTGREPAAEFWPVRWVAACEHDQLIAATQLLARSLAELGPSVGMGAVVQVGGGEPPATWIVVRGDGGPEGPSLVSSLLRSLLPWLGCDPAAATGEIPLLNPTVGLHFAFEDEGGMPGPVPLRSRLLDVLGQSAGRWQLTVGTGLTVTAPPAEADEPFGPSIRFDTAVSLIGSGAESVLAATLLAADVSTADDPVRVTVREATGDGLKRLAEFACAGLAPPSGFLDPVRTGRLLSLPMRLAGDRPPPVGRPAPPEATARLFRRGVPPHVLVVGGSGQGKTTLLHHAALDAARGGRSTVVVLSPHGDLVVRLASSLLAEGLGYQVLHFGAEDPLGWNIMDPDPGMEAGGWAAWLARLIRRLWPEMPAEFFGPVWERLCRIVLEILIADPAGPHPITEAPAFFARESSLRDQALARIGDEALARSVREEVVPFLSSRDGGNAAVWVLAKLEGLVGNPAVARVIGVRRTEVSLEPVFSGIHTVVSAPAARLGDDGSRLLSSVFLDHLWRRVRLDPPARPIELFIDEWHRLATPAVGEILAEGRKYGLHLRLANHNASQVDPALWDTTLGNVGALISFRTGPRDAALVASMFPTVRAATLTQLPAHWVAATTGEADHVGPAPAPLPGVADPRALQVGHLEARRVLAADAAERGCQLCLAFADAAPEAALREPGDLRVLLRPLQPPPGNEADVYDAAAAAGGLSAWLPDDGDDGSSGGDCREAPDDTGPWDDAGDEPPLDGSWEP